MRFIPDYNRTAAVEYAHRWAYGRNPAYYNFDSLGGDCTNFASQCLYAGTGVMNYTPTFGWYYISLNNRAPAWTGVPFFYNFLIRTAESAGPKAREVTISELMPGDFVQLSFTGEEYGHTPVVVAVQPPYTSSNILVAAHTNDTDYRPLSTYSYKKARFLHIEGFYSP